MADTHQEIVKVWIAPGCIVCDSCENDCPEVFEVQEETCIIRPEAIIWCIWRMADSVSGAATTAPYKTSDHWARHIMSRGP